MWQKIRYVYDTNFLKLIIDLTVFKIPVSFFFVEIDKMILKFLGNTKDHRQQTTLKKSTFAI